MLSIGAGCSVSFPQVDAARALATGTGGGGSVEKELEALAWRLAWAGRSLRVYPVDARDVTVFTNPDDLQLVFDGWQFIRVLELLPGGRTARIDVLEGPRMVFYENDVELLATPCQPWRTESLPDGGVVRLQDCDALPEPNRMQVGADGVIEELEYYVHPDYPRLRLRRSNDDG